MDKDTESEIIAVVDDQPVSKGSWTPFVGNELMDLLDKKSNGDEVMRQRVQSSTLRILSSCVNPGENEAVSNTGLIVGYVQSGKTLSYTALIASARDNHIPIVIVIAGNDRNLTDQTSRRLKKDLDISKSPRRPFAFYQNPTASDKEECIRQLEMWRDRPDRVENKTLIISLMKHAKGSRGHLRNLTSLLQSIPTELKTAALVIDDEADQASLNTAVNQNDISAVYSAIADLRLQLPRHSFLQYTATPQANIFIPLVDELSPDFHEPLQPGSDYVGGAVFFGDQKDTFVKEIPQSETNENWGEEEPPPTLIHALQTFFIGVAVGNIFFRKTNDHHGGQVHRSMMIHPSRINNSHGRYEHWVKKIKNLWINVLEEGAGPDYEQLLSEFKPRYEDLKSGAITAMPSLSEVMNELREERLHSKVRVINNQEIMTEDDWPECYAWILIGGQKLDRGFTIEGLTVTYMPRGPGVGNSDTIQQRGRFFGYKRQYLDVCRIWLEPDMIYNYEKYVDAENSMRQFLEKNKAPGALKSKELRRAFQLDPAMRPCRANILLNNPAQVNLGDDWVVPNFPLASEEFSAANREHIEKYVIENDLIRAQVKDNSYSWITDSTNLKSTHLHEVLEMDCQTLFKDILCNLVVGQGRDQDAWQTALAVIEDRLATQDHLPPGLIVWIRPHCETTRTLEGPNGLLGKNRLFQGAYPPDLSLPSSYLGDERVRKGPLTLQIHTIKATERSARKPADHPQPFTALALYLGTAFSGDYVVQTPSMNS